MTENSPKYGYPFKGDGHYCLSCGKPYVYVGDVPVGGFRKGEEPWCTCHDESAKSAYKYCPHCGKELI